MRKLPATIAALVLAACSPGAPGPQGPQGPPGIAADASLIATLAMRVNELEARQAVKVPHLVHAETGEDLGHMLDWQTAWNEELQAPVQVVAAPLYFAEADCKGDVRINVGGQMRYVLAADGRVVEVMRSNLQVFTATSRFDAGIGCQPTIEADRYPLIAPTGATMSPPSRVLVRML